MATSFPTGLDALTNPTSSDGLNSPDHAGQHSDANDAIEALEAKVGINSSAVTSSLDYKITNINASNLASGTVPTGRMSGSYAGITGLGTLGSLTVTGDVTVDTNTLKVDSTNNRVGIANASPAYALDVTGTVQGTQFLQGTDYLSPYQGFRNALINGSFNIWQRGTSLTGYAYTADRWLAYNASTVNTISRQAASLSGFQYCARVQRNSGATSTGLQYLVQAVESVNSYYLQGKPVILSFWARKGANYSSSSSVLSANIETSTGTDQSYISAWAGSSPSALGTVTLTTTWQKFTISSGIVPLTANQVAVAFYYTPVGTAGAADYFEITGVQLEQGSVATPFEQRPIGTELALCQRYYFRTGTHGGYLLAGFGPGSLVGPNGNVDAVFPLPVPMRIAPTSIGYSTLRITDYQAAFTIASITLSTIRTSTTVVQATVSSPSAMTLYRPYVIEGNNSTSAYFEASAEM